MLLLRRRPAPDAPLEAAASPASPVVVDPEDRPLFAERRPRRWLVVAGIVVVALAAYAGWRFMQFASPPLQSVVVPPAPSAPKPETAEPAVRYPLPETLSEGRTDASLPSLADSDAVLGAAIVGLAAQTPLKNLLQRTEVVRRIVVTVDNLPRNKVPRQLLPLAPPAGAFVVVPGEPYSTLDARNEARYAAYLRIVDAVDPKTLASLYGAYYPLFQEQYRSLGYPKGNFNDRVIEAIDDLLATPAPPARLALAQPKVLYEFADPALEARSAGQKMMLRLSPAESAKVKAKLRAIRSELAAAGPPAPGN